MENNLIRHELRDLTLESLHEGMSAKFDITITEKDFQYFSEFAYDTAPVHNNSKIASEMGYPKPIVYGFMVFSRFSGLLGMVLPGPRTVIHTAHYAMKKPVFIGDKLTYSVEVKKIVKSVKAVILDLKVFRDNEMVLKGETQCGFNR
ncbi:MAG: hypothetical protein IPM57_00750 [Oligoflexia bacterium]|nr:hypothetical protein [Oligoflexia bacterium]